MATTVMTDVQVARLQDALDDLAAHPERHKQSCWMSVPVVLLPHVTGVPVPVSFPVDEQGRQVPPCGTAMCLAGDVVIRNGWRFTVDTQDLDDYWGRTVVVLEYVTDDTRTRIRHVETVARELLGLDEVGSRELFAAGNTLTDLWVIGHCLTGGRLTLPPDVGDDLDWLLSGLEGREIVDRYLEAGGR